MFLLNNQPIEVGFGFTDAQGIQRPGNWLQLATPEELQQAGITVAPDPEPYDARFYYAANAPKDHGELVKHWTAEVNAAAHRQLSSSDWMVVRELETGVAVPDAIKGWRDQVRQASNDKVAKLAATSSTEDLAAVVKAPGFAQWPAKP